MATIQGPHKHRDKQFHTTSVKKLRGLLSLCFFVWLCSSLFHGPLLLGNGHKVETKTEQLHAVLVPSPTLLWEGGLILDVRQACTAHSNSFEARLLVEGYHHIHGLCG